jgi:hypothetical protein
MKNFIVHSFTVVMFSFFAVSCGNTPSHVLTGVKVGTQTIENDLWMSFAADLNLGTMSFGSITVPIIHPKGQTPIGQLDLMSGLGGTNQLKISLNISELSDIQPKVPVLPNGNMVPLLANNEVISISLGKGAKIYLAISDKITAIGVAIPIGAFDNIGGKLPGLNFFPIINTSGVIGTAGLFTSKTQGQNGIAVVADVSSLVNLNNLLQQAPVMMAIEAEQKTDSLSLDYRSHSISAAKEQSLNKMIIDLNRKRTILKLK